MLHEELQTGGPRAKSSQNHVLFGPHSALTIGKVTYKLKFLAYINKMEGSSDTGPAFPQGSSQWEESSAAFSGGVLVSVAV